SRQRAPRAEARPTPEPARAPPRGRARLRRADPRRRAHEATSARGVVRERRPSSRKASAPASSAMVVIGENPVWMRCVLREVLAEDLALLFEQWADPVAVQMAAFAGPDHMEWDAFERRWSRLRADETVLPRAIVVDGDVVGTIGSWGDSDEREVTYWI